MTPTQSGTLIFKPRARLLKLIGSELISDEVVALTELVKNAYDADASYVEIEFVGTDTDDPQIVIRDNGHGMSLDTLLRHWMEPAHTSKSGNENRFSARGRRYLGEKGVGRFAVDKLASCLHLVSRTPGSSTEIVAEFNWDAFDSEHHLLSDIEHHWTMRPAVEIADAGTVLRLKGLRTIWNERMFRRLCTRLARLRSPFETTHDFTIRIDSDEFPDYTGEVSGGYLQCAPYRLEASFDGEETISVSLNGGPVQTHFYRHGSLSCGPVRIQLAAFDLETDALARIGPRADVRAWLRDWSGVSIFRDDFRLWPYGEPHDDWLRLDQRRVNNPVVCLSNNQVVGFVEIGSDLNPDLRDQTNREGLINNQAFRDLRMLMYHVLNILEASRQDIRHPTRARREAIELIREREIESEAIASDLDRLSAKADLSFAPDLQRIVQRIRDYGVREAQRYRTLHETYVELAAIGHTATTLVKDVQQVADALQKEKNVGKNGAPRSFTAPEDTGLGSVQDTMAFLHCHLERLALTPESNNGRRRAIDVLKELELAEKKIRPLLTRKQIEHIDIRADESVLVRTEMRPENFHRIIHILAENALDWIGDCQKPKIQILVNKLDEAVELIFSDNGSGISPEISERVFEPGFSWKENGRGMGLTIARSLLELHGGTIAVCRPKGDPGAVFRVLLPLKRARAT